jgi:hypothetical protein
MVSGVLGTIEHEQRWENARRTGAGKAIKAQFSDEELERSKTDWRPLVSYTTNLSRIGQEFLGSEAAWEKVSRLQPAQMRSGFLLKYGVWQFPWHWSALVLAGLALISICILNLSVKSLDRLK